MTSPIDGKVVPFGKAVDTFHAFLNEPVGDIDTESGSMPNLRKLSNELRTIAADKAEETAGAKAVEIEDRIYPGVYSTPPTNKPHSGQPCEDGDRCVILVGSIPYEHLRMGGGWVIPNVDAANLALPQGATRVGTNQGTVQEALDARPTANELAQGDGAGIGYKVPAPFAITRATNSGFWDHATAYDWGAYGDKNHDDTAAIFKTVDAMLGAGRRRVAFGPGKFLLGAQIFRAQGSPGIAWTGPDSSPIFTVASMPTACMLVWTGSALPMFSLGSSYDTFSNIGLENQGLATDGIEMNPGCIGTRFDNFGAMRPSGTPGFSRSIIRSNGNRLGYSKFRDIWANSPAPRFIDIDGMGLSNGITTIEVSGGVFGSSNGAMTIVHARDTVIELLHMHDMTLNQVANNQLLVLDTSDNPRAIAIQSLKLEMIEFDAAGADTSTHRFGKIVNALNVRANNLTINGGGTKTHAFDITNSVVSEIDASHWTSLGRSVFDVKDSKTKIYPGSNSGNRPLYDPSAITAGIHVLRHGASISIDGTRLNSKKKEVIVIPVLSSAGFTINVDTTSPEYTSVGQEMEIFIVNATSAAIAGGTFGSTFAMANGATTAPAPGNGRAYRITWNGSKGLELGSRGGDIPMSWTSGNGEPEGVVTASVGACYTQLDSTPIAQVLWVKESGAGNAGWVTRGAP